MVNKSGEIVSYYKANPRWWAGKLKKLASEIVETAGVAK